MNINLKRIYSYLAYVAAGLFNFIFMFMNYAVLFISADGNSETLAFSAYKCMVFGEESLGGELVDFIEGMTKDANLAFLTVIISIIMILMIIISVALLFAGVAGLVRELAGVNIIPGVDKKLVDKVSGIVFNVDFYAHIVSALLLVILTVCNLYTGSFLGYKLSLGVRPGLGMYFLLIFTVALWITNRILRKKFSSVPKEKVVCKCTVCGAEASDGAKFCAQCGAEVVCETVTPEEQPEAEAVNFDYRKIVDFFKKLWAEFLSVCEKSNISRGMLKKIGKISVCVILVLIIIASIPWPKPAAYVEAKEDISLFYSSEEGETYITKNGKLLKETVDGNVLTHVISMDGKTVLLMTSEKELLVYSGKGLVSVDEGVSSCKLSVDGSAVAYINEDGELVHYTVKNKKSATVSDELCPAPGFSYAISPDGKTVAYVEGAVDDFTLNLWVNGKKSEVDDGMIPLGVSEKGKLVYYYDTKEAEVYVMKKGKEPEKLAGDISVFTNARFYFNANLTQAVYTVNGSDWYISDNGKEKVKITSKGINEVGNSDDFGIDMALTSVSRVMPVESFKKQYFLFGDGTLCYLNNKLEAVTVAENVDDYEATPSYDFVYYRDGDDIYRVKGYKKKAKTVAEDASSESFVITEDGKRCYYVNDDDALMTVKKTGKPKKIADDVDSLTITRDGYALFTTDHSYENGGTLYSSRNGGKKKKLADDVLYVFPKEKATYYRVRNGSDAYDVYGVKSGVKFKRLLEEIG